MAEGIEPGDADRLEVVHRRGQLPAIRPEEVVHAGGGAPKTEGEGCARRGLPQFRQPVLERPGQVIGGGELAPSGAEVGAGEGLFAACAGGRV